MRYFSCSGQERGNDSGFGCLIRTTQQLMFEVAHEYQSHHDDHTIETTSHALEA